MRKPVKIATVCILVVISCFLCGCWDYRELETIAVVSGFAVDTAKSGKGYRLTFETLKTMPSQSPSSSGESSGMSETIQTEGYTIFDAVRNAVKKSSRKLYFGQCKTVVVSGDIAKKGIAPILDWVNRDSEPRLTTVFFISKEGTARKILSQRSFMEPMTSFELSKMDQDDPEYLSKTPYVQLYQADNILFGKGDSLYLPAVCLDDKNKDTSELCGTAVFKGDRLIGFLDQEETKYLLFIKNQVNGGLLVVNNKPGDANITFEIKSSKTKISTDLKGRSPKINIKVKTIANLAEIESEKRMPSQSEKSVEKLENEASKNVTENINSLIKKTETKYDSDIFGFGEGIYRKDPQYWEKIKPKWNTMFKTLDVSVSAEVDINGTALVKSNFKVGG